MAEWYAQARDMRTMPRAGGLEDQDWEVALAFRVLNAYFGGIDALMARASSPFG